MTGRRAIAASSASVGGRSVAASSLIVLIWSEFPSAMIERMRAVRRVAVALTRGSQEPARGGGNAAGGKMIWPTARENLIQWLHLALAKIIGHYGDSVFLLGVHLFSQSYILFGWREGGGDTRRYVTSHVPSYNQELHLHKCKSIRFIQVWIK